MNPRPVVRASPGTGLATARTACPPILAPADYEIRLRGGAGEARAVLGPYPLDVMVAYQLGTRVNSPENNDEKLIELVTHGH